MLHRLRRAMSIRDAGFTLAEVGVVVIIVGILAAIAIPVLANQQGKGVDATLKQDLRATANTSTNWLVDNPLQSGPTTTSTDQGMIDLFAAYGWRKTAGNSIYVYTKPGVGYCLFGYNSGSKSHKNLETSMLYDSAAGGLIARTAVPPTGACAA